MSDDGLCLYQVSRKYLKGFQSYSADVICYLEDVICTLKFAMGHNSVKNVGGVMVLVLSTLFDNALYLYQVLPKYLMGYESYRPEQ